MKRKIYHEEMNKTDQEKVDGIYEAVNKYCKENGIKLAYDDRAEEFIEAIAEYITDSNK